MEPIKSIAIPATRRRGTGKSRASGHPAPSAEVRVNGLVSPARRVAGPVTPAAEPLYQIGQRLALKGGGNHWARTASTCSVTAVLPRDAGPFLYRVRSEAENYERVVAEADLSPVS